MYGNRRYDKHYYRYIIIWILEVDNGKTSKEYLL